MSRRGLLPAGLGLLMLTLHLPWLGSDLTPDLVALVLVVLAGRALGSPTLVIAGALAVPLHLIGAGGLVTLFHEGIYAWWYAAAAGSHVLEGIITLGVLGAVLRAQPLDRWQRLVRIAAAAYAVAVATTAVVLVTGDLGSYGSGTTVAVVAPLIDLAQLGVAVITLLAADRFGNAEGRPRRSGSALRPSSRLRRRRR